MTVLLRWPLVFALGVTCFLGGVRPAQADLLAELIEQGVKLPSGQMIKLPAPLMADDLAPAEQQAALQAAADKYPLDRFTRDAIVSPFVLEIESLDDQSGQRRAQRVDFCFVAYGSLAAFEDEGLFDELAGAAETGSSDSETLSARALSAEELEARGLTLNSTPEREVNYITLQASILDRVELGGVAFTERAKYGQSVVAALRMEDQFAEDPEFPNRWRPILRDAAGRMSLGDPLPYSGLGGYIKVTELSEPQGALFVECHIAFDEPQAWFDGKNLLRSKLPLVVQDNVRSLRRKLANAAKASR